MTDFVDIVHEAMVEATSYPENAPPPNVLKNVMALVIVASIKAFPQSNFFSITLTPLFAQQVM
ncbi:MAG: hypothetical protein GX799_07640 [Crenarchaeota archaeon]|jgi:hypothetical protein|nr:hypothetical protein [Thermoproteota archaeon]